MNVLIFVMTMLMILSLMTYAKLETYFSGQIFEQLFIGYMEKEERGYINQAAMAQYDDITVSKKEGKKSPKIAATPRLSLELLANKKLRDSKPGEWRERQILLKSLMRILYQDQPFFQRMQEKDSSFLDEMISEITHAVDELPEGQKLTKASDIANLRLSNPGLDEVLYKMLHGAPYPEINEKPVQKEDNAEKETEADEHSHEEGDEYTSPPGYYSLLDFINLSHQSKIRVYLAPKEVLLTIFPDPGTVDQILSDRKLLYKDAVGNSDPKELEDRFKSQFDSRRDPAIDSALLDYSVSKTNPKSYE